jgi:catecholate siderophore receptor
MVTMKIEHQLGAKTTLTNTSRYGKVKMDRILTGVNALIAAPTQEYPNVVAADRNTWLVARTRQSVLQDNKIMANSTNVVTEFATGSIGHTVSTGLEFLSEEQLSRTRGGLGTLVAANLYNPVGGAAPAAYNPAYNGVFTKGSTTTAAAYVFDTLKFNEQWQINAGVRAEHYTIETDATAATTLVGSHLEKSDNLYSWKAGALYKPTKDSSVYLAYATSQTPPGGANFSLVSTVGNVNGPAMDPAKTTNIELGTKWDLIQKKLALTAALYRTDNTNEFTMEDPVTNTFSQLGKRRVEGVELGVVGQITRDWNIIAGVATMDATILEGNTANPADSGTRWSPDLSATLWSTYKVNDKFIFGGGARYVSKQKRVVAPNAPASNGVPSIPSYAVVDAVASYTVSKNVTLQLNVYNLFDKFYVASLNNGGSRLNIGAERSAQLTANIAF